jgi:guanylate kinase
MSKLIIVTAPSGAGKTTIVHHLLDQFTNLAFSVSATTRERRSYEKEGKDYYFLTPDRFRQLIREEAFVEWEEVYPDQFYGTLKTEVERLWAAHKHIIFDIDVKGALNIKAAYPENALVLFIAPPSLAILRSRLQNRDTENPASLRKRLNRVDEEMQYQHRFDRVIINDDLPKALMEASSAVGAFLNAS